MGLHINARLAWGPHVRKLATCCSQQVGALRRASFCLPSSALIAAYKGTIRARMEYLSPIWCGGPQTELRLLHRLQSRALKICDLGDSTTLLRLRIQPLEVRWRTSTVALLHRVTTGVAPLPVIDLLPEPQSGCEARAHATLLTPVPSNQFGKGRATTPAAFSRGPLACGTPYRSTPSREETRTRSFNS